jgi:ketosteroid isomerase-like protein
MPNTLKSAGRTLATLLAAATFTASAHAAAAGALSETEKNRALAISGMEAWAAGTGSPYDLLAEDVRWTITGNSLAAKTYPSKEAFLSEVIRPFNARMRERLIPTVHRTYAEGDTVIVHFDASGTALDGEPYANSYAWILRMKNQQIVEAFAFFDSLAFDDFWTRVAPAERQ